MKSILAMVRIGVLAGVAAALAAARLLHRLVEGTQSTTPVTFSR